MLCFRTPTPIFLLCFQAPKLLQSPNIYPLFQDPNFLLFQNPISWNNQIFFLFFRTQLLQLPNLSPLFLGLKYFSSISGLKIFFLCSRTSTPAVSKYLSSLSGPYYHSYMVFLHFFWTLNLSPTYIFKTPNIFPVC
jgi:hypothetical protein